MSELMKKERYRSHLIHAFNGPRALALALALALCAVALATAHAQAPAPASGSRNLLIGEITPMSGPAATVGTRLHQVNKLWVDDLNRLGGVNGQTLELLTCNDEARPERAASCTRDLIDKGVSLLLLNALTAGVRASQPLLTNGPIALVLTPNIVPSADSFMFQVSPSEVDLTRAIARWLNAGSARSLAVVAATDASGESAVGAARQVFPGAGIELKLARIDLRATDASSQLAAVAAGDVKAIYSAYSGGGASVVVKGYHNLELAQPLIVSYANINAAFVRIVRDELPARLLGTSIGALVPDELPQADARERARVFARRYQEVYGEAPDMLNLIGKLSVDTAESILRHVTNPGDARAVKQYLESTPIESLHSIRFAPQNPVGLGLSDVMLVELKAGRWVKAGPVQ